MNAAAERELARRDLGGYRLDTPREELAEIVKSFSLDHIVERERRSGMVLGPFEQRWLLERKAPRDVRRLIEKARLNPKLVGGRQGFMSMDVNDFPPTNFTAVTASATETNLWTPAIWSPIPANDMRAGKAYKVSFGGVYTSTGTQGVLTFTPRAGQSSTPASNATLGASNATAPAASLTGAAWYGEFTMGIRSLGLAASGATASGNGFVIVQGAAAATAINYVMGGTNPTNVDNTAASGLIVSLTISVASQSYQANWVIMQSLN